MAGENSTLKKLAMALGDRDGILVKVTSICAWVPALKALVTVPVKTFAPTAAEVVRQTPLVGMPTIQDVQYVEVTEQEAHGGLHA